MKECNTKTFGPFLGIALVDAVNFAPFRHAHGRISQDKLANALMRGKNEGICFVWNKALDQE